MREVFSSRANPPRLTAECARSVRSSPRRMKMAAYGRPYLSLLSPLTGKACPEQRRRGRDRGALNRSNRSPLLPPPCLPCSPFYSKLSAVHCLIYIGREGSLNFRINSISPRRTRRTRRVRIINLLLRALRDLRGEMSSDPLVAALPRWGECSSLFGYGFAALGQTRFRGACFNCAPG
jgi:hypothetical protein